MITHSHYITSLNERAELVVSVLKQKHPECIPRYRAIRLLRDAGELITNTQEQLDYSYILIELVNHSFPRTCKPFS